MMKRATSGFTLIEILVASLAATLILVAVYGIFQRAVKTRDHATARIHQALQRERTASILRNDLRSAFLSGGVLASTMEGGAQSPKSRFPGYLRFTATTGRDHPDEAYGDVQQVEYSVSENAASSSGAADNSTGTLVRTRTRDLLADVPQVVSDEQILAGVQTFEVTFFDGSDWQQSWQVSGTAATLPQAIRIRIQQAAPSEQIPTPPPLEILVPLNTEALTSSTASTTGGTP